MGSCALTPLEFDFLYCSVFEFALPPIPLSSVKVPLLFPV